MLWWWKLWFSTLCHMSQDSPATDRIFILISENGTCIQPEKLLSASMDKTVIVWSPEKESGVWLENARLGDIGGSTLGFYGARFGPQGMSILASSSHGGLYMWHRFKVLKLVLISRTFINNCLSSWNSQAFCFCVLFSFFFLSPVQVSLIQVQLLFFFMHTWVLTPMTTCHRLFSSHNTRICVCTTESYL